MGSKKNDRLGKLLAEHPIVVIVGFIASCLAMFTFFTNIQSLQEIAIISGTATSKPSPTPDLANLYTFFPHPTTGSSKTFNFHYVFAEYNQATSTTEQKTENGSYTETISIINDRFVDKNIAAVGVEITNKNYLSPCHDNKNFYWYVYDSQRLYFVCKKENVFFVASEMASNNEPSLVVNSQFKSEPLNLGPDYLTPFDIGKQWQANYIATVQSKLSKTVPAGTFSECFQISFFAINYNELRYICPNIGLVAIEVNDHQDYYSAELVSIQK